jgi:hypothetical protein
VKAHQPRLRYQTRHADGDERIDPILRPEQTSAYTELVMLDERTALLIYDRVPHGWQLIPKESADTNTVWVVRLEMSELPRH